MTLYQFDRLDELEQLEALWDNGVVLPRGEDEPRTDTNKRRIYVSDNF